MHINEFNVLFMETKRVIVKLKSIDFDYDVSVLNPVKRTHAVINLYLLTCKKMCIHSISIKKNV